MRDEGRRKWECRFSGGTFKVYSETGEIMSVASTEEAAIIEAKESAHELGYRVTIANAVEESSDEN